MPAAASAKAPVQIEAMRAPRRVGGAERLEHGRGRDARVRHEAWDEHGVGVGERSRPAATIGKPRGRAIGPAAAAQTVTR